MIESEHLLVVSMETWEMRRDVVGAVGKCGKDGNG